MQCKKDLKDLSEFSLKEIVQDHYNKNKCVILNNEQIEFFSNFRKIRKYALATSLFIGVTFHNLTYSQTIKKSKQNIETCLIKGTLIDFDRKPIGDKRVYVNIKDTIYETKTLKNGDFAIVVPKNCQIEYSNIKKLISRKIRNRKKINLRKVKIYWRRSLKSPGFF